MEFKQSILDSRRLEYSPTPCTGIFFFPEPIYIRPTIGFIIIGSSVVAYAAFAVSLFSFLSLQLPRDAQMELETQCRGESSLSLSGKKWSPSPKSSPSSSLSTFSVNRMDTMLSRSRSVETVFEVPVMPADHTLISPRSPWRYCSHIRGNPKP